MPASAPPILLQPFADTGTRDVIPDLPPVTPGRASWELGFPPITMQPVIAGGVPPFGQDMNGVLWAVSSHCVYSQAGQPYQYSGSVSTAIGGYAKGAILGTADGTGLMFNTVASNTAAPGTDDTWLPAFVIGYTEVFSLVGGAVVLSPGQYVSDVLVLNGTLVAPLQIVLPTQLRSWRIVNRTAGSFSTVVKTAGGSGVTVPQGGYAASVEVYGDGVNLYPTVAPFTLPGSVAATPDTYVIRNNTSDALARYFNSSGALVLYSFPAVMTRHSDGTLYGVSVAAFSAQLSLSAIGGAVVAAQVPLAAVSQYSATLFTSPAFTGVPTAPTAAVGISDTRVATTQFANPGQSQGANGWVQLPGGVVIQWGTIAKVASAVVLGYTFPVPFASACYSVTISDTGDPNGYTQRINDITAAGFNVGADGSGADPSIDLRWIAIGA